MNARRIIPLRPAPAARGTAESAQPERVQLTTPPPLSLYVHFPWCVRKCPYCDFNSHAIGGASADIPQAAWIAAVVADLEAALPQVWGRRVHSVFIGGGTPSLLTAGGADELLTAIRMRLPLDPLAEITLEANPGTAEAERFRAYRAAGINRLSLGIQSFDDTLLERIGRIHNGTEARRAIDAASAHFEQINLDLMYALPGQTPEQALNDLETALAFKPGHLSCYHLTMEPNTPFGHSPPPRLPDADSAADMQDAIEAHLATAGFEHYETSAFARPGARARHNLNYWTFGDYLGIGPGAHGKLSSHDGIVREMRHKHPQRYLDGAARGDFVQERHAVTTAELPFEFMMNALRLTDGFPVSLFTARTGLSLEAAATGLRTARERGLIEIQADILRPTERGRRFLNDLLQMFLAD